VRDDNGAFLARELTRLGAPPDRVVIVGDRPEDLSAALRQGLVADLCVISGGLGPTHDDRTVELLARETGKELVVDEHLRARIEVVSRSVAERLGMPYADFEPGVRKQASLPAGGVALGLAGTAPAVLLEHDGGVAVALPGPPGELRRLWERVLEHEAVKRVLLRAHSRGRRLFRLLGPSESAVAGALAEAGEEEGGLEITVCARDLEIMVDLVVPEGSAPAAARIERSLRDAFGTELFAVDDERSVAELVLDHARAASLRLATAESCTGGLVGARLTDIPGSSDVYVGGLVAYSDELKLSALGVPEETLHAHGAVSEETAAAMAAGARARLGGDIGVAVTGVAGPGGGTPEKPVGLVYIHIEAPQGAVAWSGVLPGDREAVRSRATAMALQLLRRHLAQNRDEPA
jgi:nicotinamide-nucleotide amidase